MDFPQTTIDDGAEVPIIHQLGYSKQKSGLHTIFVVFYGFKNMDVRVALLLFMLLLTAESQAQFWKSKKLKSKNEPTSQQPNSLDPTTSTRKEYAPRESSKSARRSSLSPEQQFYERMEDVAKVRRKNERMMEKPQYSDPMYFGHKRPPKKRKASRMKFCKECGIRH